MFGFFSLSQQPFRTPNKSQLAFLINSARPQKLLQLSYDQQFNIRLQYHLRGLALALVGLGLGLGASLRADDRARAGDGGLMGGHGG